MSQNRQAPPYENKTFEKNIKKKKKKTVIIFLSNQKKYAKETVLFHLPIQNKKLCRSPKQDKKKEAYP